MNHWPAKKIRQTFLSFFASKQHHIVPSAPMVIKNDPTLMFTNAGMNPFKDLFLGLAPVTHARIADTQKCLRVSGKHNDLEEVGHDTYHHTMFEMLGNWSFGDYFKKEAIAWAWELLTEVYGIEKDRLYVTIFEGDATENLQPDEEAREFWKQWIAEDRILLGNKKDNFWEMGSSGPCGPCSEIHIDLRSHKERAAISGAALVNNDHPQVVEVWNLVFMEFNRKADGSLEPLPHKHVDTGMGFERLSMALQGKTSNYDTDVFTPLLEKVAALTGIAYGKNLETDIAMRVIVDHVRAVAFAIADGQMPANNGAGYVIRRILRRAVRYGFTYLNKKEPYICELVAILKQEMGDSFPEIKAQEEWVTRIIREEEASFLRTLGLGLHRIDTMIGEMTTQTLDGAKAFELYDTFGFPPDLTRLILKEKGLQMDEEGFDLEMQQQKERSKAATKLSTDDWIIFEEHGGKAFLGYDQIQTESKIVRYRKATAGKKTFYQIVLDKTPFYPEGGGQVGDTGTLVSIHEKLHIINTLKENGLIVHISETPPENPTAVFEATIHRENRSETAKNHTSTHLLHEALRLTLGDHVTQKGSLVHPEYLRFDFSHVSKMSTEELKQVEALVNEKIQNNLILEEHRAISMDTAKTMGAMMLFGEKYGDEVRAIKFGSSIELCGGTHVAATGAIGLFKIISEGAVAAGIRRIEAVSGARALDYINEQLAELNSIKAALKGPNPLPAIEKLKAENTELSKEVERLQSEKAREILANLDASVEQIGTFSLLTKTLPLDANAIKSICFEQRNKPSFIGLYGNKSGDKVTLSLVLSDDVLEKTDIKASTLIKELSREIRGGGGGQPFFATAGGNDASGLERAYDKLRAIVKSL